MKLKFDSEKKLLTKLLRRLDDVVLTEKAEEITTWEEKHALGNMRFLTERLLRELGEYEYAAGEVAENEERIDHNVEIEE